MHLFRANRFPPAAIVVVVLLLLSSLSAQSATTVEQIRSRGELRCGVSDQVVGLAEKGKDGAWRGFEVDFCRAVAAAVTGDGSRIRLVPLAASARLPALLGGRIDLLLRHTTWTLSREAGLQLSFPAVLLYDGQTFLVPAGAATVKPADLAGALVCVEKDTIQAARLDDYSERTGLAVKPLRADTITAAAEDFYAGRCSALTSNALQLAALRMQAGRSPEEYRILEEQISEQAIAPVVRGGDAQWESLVRWIVHGLILAEETGVDSRAAAAGNVPAFSGRWGSTDAAEFALIARALGVEPGWQLRSIAAAGNYGEIFERNLGRQSPLDLDRGPNRLWKDGGLLYSPSLK